MTGSDNRIQQPYPLKFQTTNTFDFFPPKKTKEKEKNRKERMAAAFLSTANTFLPSTLSSSSSSSTTLTTPTSVYPHKHSAKRQLILCKAVIESPLPSSPILTKRTLSICLTTAFLFSVAGKGYSEANAAILEADDDEELMEKVKKDRKKRLERQGVISSSNKETGWLFSFNSLMFPPKKGPESA